MILPAPIFKDLIMAAVIKKLVFAMLKNKKTRRVLVGTLLCLFLVSAGALVATGMLPFVLLGQFLTGLFNFFTGLFGNDGKSVEEWSNEANARTLIECFDNGAILSDSDEITLRITTENFVYLLHKVDDYNNADKLKRVITVEGIYESDSSDEEDSSSGSEKVERNFEVDNSLYEGISEMDWRLFYYYCVLAACDRSTSDKTLNVTNDNRAVGERYYINADDIDRVFDYVKIKYEYSFDVLRDESHKTAALDNINKKTYLEHYDNTDIKGKDLIYEELGKKTYISYDDELQSKEPIGKYTYEESQGLPHYVYTESDSGGTYTFYVPQSVLASGKGGYTTIENEITSGKLTGVKFYFDKSNFETICKGLFSNWQYGLLSSILRQCPGGDVVCNYISTLESQGEKALMVTTTPSKEIFLGAMSGTVDIQTGGFYGGYSTIGEAAVRQATMWVEEGAASGFVATTHTTPHGTELHAGVDWNKWYYTQTTDRTGDGADCSSFIARAYNAVGLDIAISSTTATFYSNMNKYSQQVALEDIQPGDCVLWYGAAGRSNHIAMYVGDGMMVAAHRRHVNPSVYSAADDLAWVGKKGAYLIRPYVGLASSFVPTVVTGNSQATDYANLSEAEIAELALTWAVADSKKTNIVPSVGAGQMILESGYLKTELAKKANNCFGMKCPDNMKAQEWSSWDGVSYIEIYTKEQTASGSEYTITAKFKKYASIEESVADHGGLLSNSARYKSCVGVADYRSAITIIKNGGYATDTKYVDKVCSVIQKYNLNRYDSTFKDMKVDTSEVYSDGTSIKLNTSWEYASSSAIHSGAAKYYKASKPNGKTVCVNAGHGTSGGSSKKTNCHPDGSAKVTGGSTAAGATTATAINEGTTLLNGMAEADANLKIALSLKDKLLNAGYNVVMIRETKDVQLDNIARTVIANNTSDIHIAIHYDSTTSNKGAFYMAVPNVSSYRSMEPVKSHYKEHNALGEALISGLRSNGVKIYGSGSMEMDLTQTSYSTIASMDIEVGDRALEGSDYEADKIATGLLYGINEYFGF